MHVTSDPVVHAATPAAPRDRLLRISDVEAATGCKKSTIYKLMREGRFPARVRITARFAVWPESAVMAWVQARIAGVKEGQQ
jgi:prophage regulatory protein